MKLKHKILPLLFLGLSPGAGKAQNSVPQDSTKILHTEVFTPEEQQENDKEVQTAFTERYNQVPENFDVEKLCKLLEITQNPQSWYNTLKMPLDHVLYLGEHLSENTLKELGYEKGQELVADYLRKNDDISVKNARVLIFNDNLYPYIKHNYKITGAILDEALKDPLEISSNTEKKAIIYRCATAYMEDQDNEQAVEQYLKIFDTATNLIRNYNPDAANVSKQLEAINWYSGYINGFNQSIKSNTLLDRTMAIKVPRDAVLRECKITKTKVMLAQIYNDAYYDMSVTSGQLVRKKMSPAVRQIYDNYLKSIKIYKNIDEGHAGEKDKVTLAEIKKNYPEVELFYGYFSKAYMDNIQSSLTDYMLELRESKKEKKVPEKIMRALKTRAADIVEAKAMMNDNGIDVPSFDAATHKVDIYAFNKSDWHTNNIYFKINDVLEGQMAATRGKELTVLQLSGEENEAIQVASNRIQKTHGKTR